MTVAAPVAFEPCDVALVMAARAGDALAVDALFRRYSRLVHGVAARLLGADDDRDDVVQETYVQALRGLPRLQTPQAFVSWLASITVATTQRVLRRRQLLNRLGLLRTSLLEDESTAGPAAPPPVAAELHAVSRKIAVLPPHLRRVFLLRRVDGLPMPEIARLAGVSLTTTKRRLAAAERELGLGHAPRTGNA